MENTDLGKREELEELLLKREQLYKQSQAIKTVYLQQFGELTAEVFQTKIECIRLKKMIAVCQKAVNTGDKINVSEMQQLVDEEMTLYDLQLEEMLNENLFAKQATTSDDYTVEMAKRIYRRLAKRLHPDINARTEESAELSDLWNEVCRAYHANNYERLEELEIMLDKLMRELGEKGFAFKIDDIDVKLERVREQIEEIITTRPYTYREFLEDPEAVEARKKELEKELQEFKTYKEELEEILNGLLEECGGMTWQMTLS